MAVQYLEDKHKICEVRQTEQPRYGMAADGYTLRSGAPSRFLVRLDLDKRFRRVMIWQFSNAGTAFVMVKGQPLVIRDEGVLYQ